MNPYGQPGYEGADDYVLPPDSSAPEFVEYERLKVRSSSFYRVAQGSLAAIPLLFFFGFFLIIQDYADYVDAPELWSGAAFRGCILLSFFGTLGVWIAFPLACGLALFRTGLEFILVLRGVRSRLSGRHARVGGVGGESFERAFGRGLWLLGVIVLFRRVNSRRLVVPCYICNARGRSGARFPDRTRELLG